MSGDTHMETDVLFCFVLSGNIVVCVLLQYNFIQIITFVKLTIEIRLFEYL